MSNSFKKCKYCKSIIIKNSSFCSNCGKEQNERRNIMMIIGALIIIGIFRVKGIIILMLGAFLYVYIEKEKEEEIEEERLRIEKEREIRTAKENRMIKKALKDIFNDKEMRVRLKEFILQHTKRYDNDQIGYSEYLEKIDLFLVYINKLNKEGNHKNTEVNWNKEGILGRKAIENYIETKKIQVYSENFKKQINVEDYEKIEDVIHEYIDIFGENALKDLNLKILSDSLNRNYEYISDITNKEFHKVKKEYEIRKLENDLFKSVATLKDIDYIDKLSGFEFEDYLEDLFTEFGYNIKELPYTNDYGADLIINKGFEEIVIQAKNYSTNVGNKAVQEVIAAKSYYKSDIGMVIANAYYTQNAIKTAEASDIILIDRDGLERIINEGSMYFNAIISNQ